ncbi:hypothetical protein VRU48_02605 [Pedobacter sp. KR3-3]|uniref:Uncharacterized protein n=1 Tax=Pedobacter albus TaxID=3113905 RepID=A0ABU7I3D7_9SPHI|nr:hypothetical protein [Pedobacter sp. KR3-3]MEE1943982.1 hypothetical protein [Pedobacter sp. KR3-3]
MDKQQEIEKQKNSNASILFIILNLILLAIFLNIGHATEDESMINLVCLAGGLVVLLAGYAFSYHGKPYRLGKWLFAIALLIGLGMLGLLLYAAALGKAFSH